MRQSPGRCQLMKIWVRLILVGFETTGCASAKSETDHRIGLLGVWFTNLQTVPSQTYSAICYINCISRWMYGAKPD